MLNKNFGGNCLRHTAYARIKP